MGTNCNSKSTSENGIKEILDALGLNKKASLYILLVVKIFALIAHRNDMIPEHYADIDYRTLHPEIIALHISEMELNYCIHKITEFGLMGAILIVFLIILAGIIKNHFWGES